MLLGILFFAIPVAFVIYQSLTDTPLLGSGHFIGFANYTNLFSDGDFLHSLAFGALFTLIATPTIVVSGYALGMLMRTRRRLAGFFRVVYLAPYVIGLTTLSYMAVLEFQPQYGGFDQVLKALKLGNGSTAWLIRPNLAIVAATLLSAWYAVGLGMILFMTAMQGISPDVLEAARVDGAGWWSREWRIIFPLVRRTVALVSITTVSGSFLAFTQFYILTHGGPGVSTATPVLLTYITALQQFRLGYASAMSLILLVLVAALSAGQFYLFRANEGRQK